MPPLYIGETTAGAAPTHPADALQTRGVEAPMAGGSGRQVLLGQVVAGLANVVTLGRISRGWMRRSRGY